MVNALLGRVMAPTGSAETTTVVAVYEHGDVESASVVLNDGSSRQMFLTDEGRLPSDLPVPAQDVAFLRVRVPGSPFLGLCNVIDTPGLSSIRSEISASTTSALTGRLSLDVDAVLFLLHGLTDEIDAISEFQQVTEGLQGGVANVLGIINKADVLGNASDPLGAAERKARRLLASPELRHRLLNVIPSISLLAETANAECLTRPDMQTLLDLSRSPDLDLLLSDADLFLLDQEGGIAPGRRRLLSLLGLHGVRVALEGLRAEGGPKDAMIKRLRDASGFTRITSDINRFFVPRTEALKADQVLAAVDRLSQELAPATGEAVRAEMERLLLDPSMAHLREVRAWRHIVTDEVELSSPWLGEQLHALISGTTARERLGLPPGAADDAVCLEAKARAARALRIANSPLAGRRSELVAEVLRSSFTAMATNSDPETTDSGRRKMRTRGRA